MKRKIIGIACLVICLTAVFLCALFTPAYAAQVSGGTCGEKLTWTLDDAGKLTISGTGAMTSWGSGESPWSGNSEIKTVTINDGVTSIGKAAFYDCRQLTNITISSSVTSIEDDAFRYCESLGGITLPSSVKEIGNSVFYWCESLSSITIPNGVQTIGDYMFDSCESLRSVTLPNSITYIGESAFRGCEALKSIKIPDGVITIGDEAFSCCYSLTGVIIPNSVTSVGEYAFSWCTKLTSATFSEKVTDIENYMFFYCESLQKVTLLGSITHIGSGAFQECYGLENVYITDINAWCNVHFGNYEANPLRSGRLRVIDENENEITDIRLDTSVTHIPSQTFCVSNITSITIPVSVTSIGNGAFQVCSNLTDVYYEGTEEQWKALRIGEYNECLTSANIHYDNSGDVVGDVNGDYFVNTDDAVQLLLHISMPELFDITAPADFDNSGSVDTEDVVKLLLYISMPDQFPL